MMLIMHHQTKFKKQIDEIHKKQSDFIREEKSKLGIASKDLNVEQKDMKGKLQ